jgi:alpha-beta hydrolase superfamily lysophospholipase
VQKRGHVALAALAALAALVACGGPERPRREDPGPPPVAGLAPRGTCADPVSAVGRPAPGEGAAGEIVACARDAHGYRVAYRTTRSGGEPAIATARVLLPSRALDGPVPFVVSAHGTVGLADVCAPSRGSPDELTRGFAAHGWPVIAPDYAGLGSPGVQGYGDHEDTARSVLDAARAMRALVPEGSLSGQAVLVGHSQGGGAVLSAQAIARRYLGGDPGVALAAVIAVAPGWPVRSRFDVLRDPRRRLLGRDDLGAVVGALFLYQWHARTLGEERAGEGFAAAHRAELTRAIEQRCVGALLQIVPRLAPTLGDLVDEELRAGLLACMDGAEGCEGRALALHDWSRANVMQGDPEGAPIHVLQGSGDGITTPARTRCIVDHLAGGGLRPSVCVLGADHLSITTYGLPRALAIAGARVEGAVPPACEATELPDCSYD